MPTVSGTVAWFVDPSNVSGLANDKNSGISALLPLITMAELAMRLQIVNATDVNTPYSVTIMSNITDVSANQFVWNPKVVGMQPINSAGFDTGEVEITFSGTTTNAISDTIATASNASGNTSPKVSGNTILDWTPYLGKILVTAGGSCATILKDLTLGIAEISPWLNPNTLSTTPPSVGVAFSVKTLPTVPTIFNIQTPAIKPTITDLAFVVGQIVAIPQQSTLAQYIRCTFSAGAMGYFSGPTPAYGSARKSVECLACEFGTSGASMTTKDFQFGNVSFIGCGFLNLRLRARRGGSLQLALCNAENSQVSAEGSFTDAWGALGGVITLDDCGFYNWTSTTTAAVQSAAGGQILITGNVYGTTSTASAIATLVKNGGNLFLTVTPTLTSTGGGGIELKADAAGTFVPTLTPAVYTQLAAGGAGAPAVAAMATWAAFNAAPFSGQFLNTNGTRIVTVS